MKSKAQNPKSETNPNFQKGNVPNWFRLFSARGGSTFGGEFGSFDIVSDFDIRISDLKFVKTERISYG